jgi:alpha/beta hydrolase fold
MRLRIFSVIFLVMLVVVVVDFFRGTITAPLGLLGLAIGLVIRDIIFNSLTLHLLKPKPAPTNPMPVIVYIFGGAFRMGNKDSGLEPLIPLVQRGYLGASIEYRYSSEALFPAQVQDCNCAIRFLRANASSLNLDPERIGVWGPSAGGYLSTMMGVTNSELLVEALQNVEADVTFHRVAGVGHGGELFESEEVLGLVHSFFDKHLLGKRLRE